MEAFTATFALLSNDELANTYVTLWEEMLMLAGELSRLIGHQTLTPEQIASAERLNQVNREVSQVLTEMNKRGIPKPQF